MKDIIKYYLQLIVLMFCLFTSACSDDDETVTPVFPDLQKIECAVGDTKTLTFEAADASQQPLPKFIEFRCDYRL